MKLKKRARFHYWSCSRFANWIRGSEKAFALPMDEWEKWRKESSKKHPFRYWVAEEVLDFLQDIVNFPMDIYHTIDVYVRNRYIDKLHYLHTGLKPGEYYDVDWRILYGLFNELVNFIELECAAIMRSSENAKNYKFKKGRCPLAGLDYLNWAGQLKLNEDYGYNPDDPEYNKPTSQAESAQKILELYNWWKNRDNRPDAHSVFSKEKDGPKYYTKIGDLENKYYEEDTQMLIELIKIRRHLWT